MPPMCWALVQVERHPFALSRAGGKRPIAERSKRCSSLRSATSRRHAGGFGSVRQAGPVRAGAYERKAHVARQAAAHDVLPVRDVQYDLPDIVPPPAGTPQRLAEREAPERPPEPSPVPRPAIERLVEQVEQERAARI